MRYLHKFRGRILLALAALALLVPFFVSTASGRPQEAAAAESDEPREIPFIQVDLDSETRRADSALKQYLEDQIQIRLIDGAKSYEVVIDELIEATAGGKMFLARVTPYVYVVAEILGARMEVIATYLSESTDLTTYRSYFVLRADEFAGYEQSVDGVRSYLRGLSLQGEPASFIYHSKFSTSSYFVPSRFFREQRIFDTQRPTDGMARILKQEREGGSTDLVKAVAREPGTFAAVWDGTQAKFLAADGDRPEGKLYAEYGRDVVFIPLEVTIPNDLLVASETVPETCREKLRNALSGMDRGTLQAYLTDEDRSRGRDLGDFAYWINVDRLGEEPQKRRLASQARTALSELRRLSRERTAPVIVDIQADDKDAKGWLPAVEAALELSGTEFVRYDEAYHKARDVVWHLESIHDGALLLRSQIEGMDDEEVGGAPLDQEFRISFLDAEDLSYRIGELIHKRMHRIRYLWPYWDKKETPTVIRDVAFALEEGTPLHVQKIRWIDPDRNQFALEQKINTQLAGADFSKFQTQPIEDLEADPLSDVSYRVILMRPTRQSTLLSIFGGLFVALLVAAAALALWETRRQPMEARASA